MKKSVQQKILSIIIPMYNSESFIKKCLDSMIMEEKEMSQIEVLVIDDGSTDGAFSIVEEYVRRWPDTIRLLRKENGGHGSAINMGVANCAGRYFKVVDADDWVLTESLRQILRYLQNIVQTDVVLSGYQIFNIRNRTMQKVSVEIENNSETVLLDLEAIIREWSKYKRLFCLHGLIYGTAFYRNVNKHLPEHVYYDDAYFDVVYVSRANKFCVINVFLYVYRIGDMQQSVSNENRVRRIHEMEKVLIQILETDSDEDGLSEAGKEYWYRRVKQFLSDYFITAFLRENNRRRGRKTAHSFFRKIKKLNPKLYCMCRKNYGLLKVMGSLHVHEAWMNKFFHVREQVSLWLRTDVRKKRRF